MSGPLIIPLYLLFRYSRNFLFRKVENIYQFKMQNQPGFSNSSMDETSWIKNICGKENSAEKAVPLIISQIEAPPFYYKCAEQIRSDLFSAMKDRYKDKVVDVKLFGSALTTLALKESDVDLFVDFGENLPQTSTILAKSVRNKLKKNKNFHETFAILARVPIVKCRHDNGISCDISFENHLAFCNSNFIKFLIQIDDRIRPLILIIKYLLKKKKLVKEGCMSSYIAVSLVIFFLQQLKNPLLPTVAHLQSLSSEKKTQDLWETAFVTDPTLLPPTTNESSIPVLLKQFFEFYSTFRFDLYVISCYTGKTYLKQVFENADLLPEEYECYKKNVKENSDLKFECDKYMCVQCFFNHSKNITGNISEKYTREFQNFCFESKLICAENMEEGGKSNSTLFESLFLNAMGGYVRSSKKQKSKNRTENILIYLEKNKGPSNHNCTEEDLRKDGLNSTVSRVKDILVKEMKCRVNESPPNINEASFFASGETLEVFHCELHPLELFKKRNDEKEGMKSPKDKNLVNKEKLILDLRKSWPEHPPQTPLKFFVVCSLNSNPTCLQLSLRSVSKSQKNLLNPVVHFIKQCVQ